MVLTTTSFHLFGITLLICTPSLIRNLRTAFAHPPRRKIFIPSLIWTRGAVLDTRLSGFLKKYFSSHLFPQRTAKWTPFYGKVFTPSLVPTEKHQMHPLNLKIFIVLHLFPVGMGKCIPILKKYPSTSSHWERLNAHPFSEKIFVSSLICNGKGYFLSLFAKIPFTCSHRASANYRVF